MKKAISVIVIVVVIFILTACSCGNRLAVDFKSDTYTNFGVTAAVYNDRIYYVSNEQGAIGLYSMDLNGSDVRVEAENPSIKKLVFCDDSIYYNGLYRINKEPGLWRSESYAINDHTLYVGELGEQPRSTGEVDSRNNIVDFFISENGYRIVSYGAASEEMYLYDNTSRFIDREEMVDQKKTLLFKYDNEEIQKDIYEFGDLLILSKHFNDDYDYHVFASNEDPFVFNTHTGELVFKYTTYPVHYSEFKAFNMDDNHIYCAYKNMILIFNRADYQTEIAFIPDGITNDYLIDHMMISGKDMYLIADQWRGERYSASIKNEKLYKIDLDTLVCTELLDLNSRQRIVGLNDDYIILLDKKEIYKIDLRSPLITAKRETPDKSTGYYLKQCTSK